MTNEDSLGGMETTGVGAIVEFLDGVGVEEEAGRARAGDER